MVWERVKSLRRATDQDIKYNVSTASSPISDHGVKKKSYYFQKDDSSRNSTSDPSLNPEIPPTSRNTNLLEKIFGEAKKDDGKLHNKDKSHLSKLMSMDKEKMFVIVEIGQDQQDFPGSIIHASSGMCDFTGYLRQEVEGRDPEAVADMLCEDHPAFAQPSSGLDRLRAGVCLDSAAKGLRSCLLCFKKDRTPFICLIALTPMITTSRHLAYLAIECLRASDLTTEDILIIRSAYRHDRTHKQQHQSQQQPQQQPRQRRRQSSNGSNPYITQLLAIFLKAHTPQIVQPLPPLRFCFPQNNPDTRACAIPQEEMKHRSSPLFAKLEIQVAKAVLCYKWGRVATAAKRQGPAKAREHESQVQEPVRISPATYKRTKTLSDSELMRRRHKTTQHHTNKREVTCPPIRMVLSSSEAIEFQVDLSALVVVEEEPMQTLLPSAPDVTKPSTLQQQQQQQQQDGDAAGGVVRGMKLAEHKMRSFSMGHLRTRSSNSALTKSLQLHDVHCTTTTTTTIPKTNNNNNNNFNDCNYNNNNNNRDCCSCCSRCD